MAKNWIMQRISKTLMQGMSTCVREMLGNIQRARSPTSSAEPSPLLPGWLQPRMSQRTRSLPQIGRFSPFCPLMYPLSSQQVPINMSRQSMKATCLGHAVRAIILKREIYMGGDIVNNTCTPAGSAERTAALLTNLCACLATYAHA